MPRSKSTASAPASRSSAPATTDRHFDPTIGRRALWLLGAAVWTFIIVAFLRFSLADPPSTSVAVQSNPISNPAGPFGATMAWWGHRVLGPGVWMVLGLAAIALVVLARGIRITHPLVRMLGVVLAAICISGLHEAWIVPLGATVGPIPGLQSGLLGTELEVGLATRFGPAGSSLVLLLGVSLGLLVAADELLLALPTALLRSLQSMRGLSAVSSSIGTAVAAPFAAIATAIGRHTRRPALQPAGVPAGIGSYWESEEEDEDEDDDEEAGLYGEDEYEEEEE